MKQDHLAVARECIAKGDKFYAKAAKHMLAARGEGKTYDEIAEGVGKSRDWVSQTLDSYLRKGEPERLQVDWRRGSHATTTEIETGVKALLRDAPMEQIERMIDALPDERKRDIGAAARDSYLGMRQEFEDRLKNRTEAEIKADEARREQIMSSARRSVAGLQVELGVVAHLEAAREELAELNADTAVTPEMARKIETAFDAFGEEFRFARALLGEEV